MKYKNYTISTNKLPGTWEWEVLNQFDNQVVNVFDRGGMFKVLRGRAKVKRQAILQAKLHIDIYIHDMVEIKLLYNHILHLDNAKNKKDDINKVWYKNTLEKLQKDWPYIDFDVYLCG